MLTPVVTSRAIRQPVGVHRLVVAVAPVVTADPVDPGRFTISLEVRVGQVERD